MVIKKSQNQPEKKREEKKIMATRRIGNTTDAEEAPEAKKLKRLNAKKVIYVEIDDEVTGLYDRLKPLKMRNIYLVVPKRAIIFQSIVNLKILKRKAEDLEKNIYIITNDQNGIHLAQQIGLTVYDKLEGHDHPSLVSGKFLEDQQDIRPLKASVNDLEDDIPTRQIAKKLSISELIRSGQKKGLAVIAKNLSLKKNKTKELKKQDNRGKLVLVAPNRQALISLIVVSLIILLTISYIALPGATIHLTPKSDVLSNVVNVTLADAELNKVELDNHPRKVLSSHEITTLIKRTVDYSATGKDLSAIQNAKGVITVMNTSNQDWPLVAETRFQTSDNLVFRMKVPATIPRQKGNVPGTLDIPVVADPIDSLGQIIGERGNIGPTKFFLPKLTADSQKKIFAESKTAMTGGNAVVIKKISKEDLEAAQKRMESDLKASALTELQAAVDKKNLEQKTNLVLLADTKALQTGEAKITIPPNLEGQKLDTFQIQGEMIASGTTYDKDEMMNLLKSELKMKRNPEKRLVHVNEDSFTYRIDPQNSDPARKKIAISASIQGIEEYEINLDSPSTALFIKNIKDHIIGKDIREAKEYIQNLPQIYKVKIDSWPAWAPTMPGVPDNIKVEVEPASEE